MGKGRDNPEPVQVEVLIEKIYTITTLSTIEKEHIAQAVNLVRTPQQADKQVYLLVVKFLGWTALLTVLGSFILILVDELHTKNGDRHPIPTGLIALGSACVGALAGLLAPTPFNHKS
jgi:hypothetical protein